MSYDMRSLLTPSRCSIAMWDFSWLHCHHPGGSYEDWGKALQELKERGFNTVRIDAFPLLIGQLQTFEEEVTVLAEPVANWGPCDSDVRHRVFAELLEFLRLCKECDVFVILSAWNLIRTAEYPELKGPYAQDRESFKRAWSKVLDAIAAANLEDIILYVDLDQEFPFFSPYAPELSALGEDAASGADAMEAAARQRQAWGKKFAWNDAQMEYVYQLFTEMLTYFQTHYPQLRFTYSLTGYLEEVRALHIRQFDVLEVHCWIHSLRYNIRTGFDELKKERAPHDYSAYQQRVDATMCSIRPMLLQEMHNKLAFAQSWAQEIAAPLVTTEAWGPWWHMDGTGLNWQWLYDWCEECMAIAEDYSFWGITPWNYSHPYWANWANIDWYRRVNQRFIRREEEKA